MTFNIELDLMGKEVNSSPVEIDEKKISTMEEGIEFSKSVLSLLKNKVREHNLASENKTSLSQLKKIYIKGAERGVKDRTNGFSGLSRVNMYLRIVSIGKLDDSLFNKSAKFDGSFSEIDLTDNWEPSSVDSEITNREILASNTDRNFEGFDLYFKEEEPIAFASTLRNLL